MSSSARKRVVKVIKLQILAGKANPAPPVGPALGSAGVNIMAFCKEFNERTKERMGDLLPVVISVYGDKTFSFVTKQPPVPNLIKKILGISKASKVPNRDKVGTLSMAQVEEIAKIKMQDMNVDDIEVAMRMVMGSAKSMGVNVQ